MQATWAFATSKIPRSTSPPTPWLLPPATRCEPGRSSRACPCPMATTKGRRPLLSSTSHNRPTTYVCRTTSTFCSSLIYPSALLSIRSLRRLKFLVPRLPQHERKLAGEILKGDDLLLGEVSVVVVHFQQ